MNKILVKASQINNLTDARFFAARGVQWMGFNCDGTIDAAGVALSVHEIGALLAWIEGPIPVAEFGLSDAGTINRITTELNIQAVQVDYFQDIPTLQQLNANYIIRRIVPQQLDDAAALKAELEAYAPYCQAFLLDYGASNTTVQDLLAAPQAYRDVLRTLAQQCTLILQIPTNPHEVRQLAEALDPIHLSLLGGYEDKPGIRTFDQLNDLMDVLDDWNESY